MIKHKSMARKRVSASLKKEFLKKWIKGLQICSCWKRSTSLSDRKNSIKLAADVAIASSRHVSASWTRTVLADALARGRESRVLVEHVLGRERVGKVSMSAASRKMRSGKILNKCRAVRRLRKRTCLPEEAVKKKTEKLKRLVPGGEFMEDEASLIRETLDYIVSLKAQVEVMRLVAHAADLKNCY